MSSKIKVDNIHKTSDDSLIIKKCGSTTTIGSGSGQTIVVDGATVTLGRCGGAVNIASGATTSGMGRTGTVNWCNTAKTSPFSATSGSGFFVNTTGGAVTVTLPSSPSAGDIVAIADYASTAQTHNITVNRNGSKIDGACTNATISTKGESNTLLYVDGTEGWKTINNASKQISTAEFVAATGGNATITDGNYKIHVFTATGTFCVSGAGNACGSNVVEYMVVGSGGGGGRCPTAPNIFGGGGGGAGGWRASAGTSSGGPFTAGPAPLVGCVAALPVSVQTYPVTIGAGGTAGAPADNGGAGNTSVFSTITSAAGGFGAGGSNNPGGNGGSGGGGGTGPSPTVAGQPGGTGNTPPVSPPQGNNGSASNYQTSSYFGGGAGGGAGAVGGTPSGNSGGLGGTGVGTAIFPSPQAPSYGATGPDGALRYFAGGGSGAGLTNDPTDPSRIPVGGGGAAGGCYPAGSNITNGVSGTANTGGGGGSGGRGGTSGAGGSGVVVLRYRFQ